MTKPLLKRLKISKTARHKPVQAAGPRLAGEAGCRGFFPARAPRRPRERVPLKPRHPPPLFLILIVWLYGRERPRVECYQK